ncbi:polysaccharide biosynthesis protein [Marinobacter pelagius]|uniref:Exopolysaccharide/PEP-CTERM locus tyrosine autokinase n=1 Tax=Marinobacter pelagius TaxID=379482 RepID=A0A1I4T0M4_9GAMM|nr:polysaccharide biosynthesis protein [Marinobacter pelagius]SFM70282.1 exopolysaccharide/PEP-CTERM locus tyrosine autokinase [Marinobacter pelagius]
MTEHKQDREEMESDTRPRDSASRAGDINGKERTGDLQKRGAVRDSGDDRDFPQWDDSRMLVPSSLELGPGAVDRYVISKQIVKMQEPRRLTRDDMDERRIIYPESRDRELVNRFRHLRTKLLELSGGNNFTLVVSGACEGAGTSFMALNLAAAFAFDQSKTALIIDCNLRNPTLHSQLELASDTGLTDFLEDSDYDIGGIIYPTGIPRLRLIPAGSRRENPAEFFTSFRMRQFLHAIRRRYPDRFIVLDTAPIADSPDARILGELCDYSMLVVPHGKITASAAENAAQAFDPEKFVGAVING